jgi:hypothetical protein
VLVFFDVCVAIGQDSRGCAGLAGRQPICQMVSVCARVVGHVVALAGIIVLTGVVSWGTWQRAEHSALPCKGITTHECTLGTCNFVNFTIFKPLD